jgi:hypothetical protein
VSAWRTSARRSISYSLNDPRPERSPFGEVAMPLSARTDDSLPCGRETPLVCERRHEPVCEACADDHGRAMLDTRRPVARVVACQTSLPDAEPGLMSGPIELHARWRRRPSSPGRCRCGAALRRLTTPTACLAQPPTHVVVPRSSCSARSQHSARRTRCGAGYGAPLAMGPLKY